MMLSGSSVIMGTVLPGIIGGEERQELGGKMLEEGEERVGKRGEEWE